MAVVVDKDTKVADKGKGTENIKVVDISEIPRKTKRITEDWVRVLRDVPLGKAYVMENQPAGRSSAVRQVVQNLIGRKRIPDAYYVTRRKTGPGKYSVYVVHGIRNKEAAE